MRLARQGTRDFEEGKIPNVKFQNPNKIQSSKINNQTASVAALNFRIGACLDLGI
jgi:hypothetical protein